MFSSSVEDNNFPAVPDSIAVFIAIVESGFLEARAVIKLSKLSSGFKPENFELRNSA